MVSDAEICNSSDGSSVGHGERYVGRAARIAAACRDRLSAAASQTWWWNPVVVLLALLLYAWSLPAPFVFDDRPVLLMDVETRSSAQAMRGAWTRRLGLLSFAWNYESHGFWAPGYRLVNIGLHAACGLTLLALLRVLLQRSSSHEWAVTTRPTWLPLAITLIWLAHPLQTESVTYIVQRFECLAALAMLLCLYGVARGAAAARGWPWYGLAVISAWIAVQTKEAAIVLPLLALLLDRILLSSSWREVVRRRGFCHLLIIAAGVTLAVQSWHAAIHQQEVSAGLGVPGLTPWMYLSSQAGVILHYLRLSIWPASLCLDYQWPTARNAAEIYPPGCVVLALLAATGYLLWKRPRAGFAAVSFFLLLAPTSSILPIKDLAVEHRMYLPLAPLVALSLLAISHGWDRLSGTSWSGSSGKLAVVVAMLAALGGRTVARNADYLHPERLWSQAVRANPENWRARHFLGAELVKQGRLAEGIAQYEQAIRCNPQAAGTFNNLGILHARQGGWAEAADCYERALQIAPNYYQAAFNYGNLLMSQGQPEAARQRYLQAVTCHPKYPEGWHALGIACEAVNADREAVAAYRHACQLDPRARGAALRLANVLATSRDASVREPVEALRICRELERVAGANNHELLEVLAASYAANKQYSAAARTMEMAMQRSDEAAWYRLAELHARYRRESQIGETPAKSPSSTSGMRMQ